MPWEVVEALGSSEAETLADGVAELGCVGEAGCVADDVAEAAADPAATGVDEPDPVATPVVDGADAPDPHAPTIKPAITTRVAKRLAVDLENVFMEPPDDRTGQRR